MIQDLYPFWMVQALDRPPVLNFRLVQPSRTRPRVQSQSTPASQIGERLTVLSGDLPIVAPRMLWWKREHPDLFKRIRKIVLLVNFVASRLAGLGADDAFTDPSYLT